MSSTAGGNQVTHTNEAKGTKRPFEGVQSPNKWEKVKFGGDENDEKKQKFLRLMGAGKKDKKDNIGQNMQLGVSTSKDTAKEEMYQSQSPPRCLESSGVIGPKPYPKEGQTVLPEVKSFNKWEEVAFKEDDHDEKKLKFLRLMGAAKKEHKGHFGLGTHGSIDGKQVDLRKGEDFEKITKNLEQQYYQSMEMKLSGAPRRHQGLGFTPQQLNSLSRPEGTSVAAEGTTSHMQEGDGNRSAHDRDSRRERRESHDQREHYERRDSYESQEHNRSGYSNRNLHERRSSYERRDWNRQQAFPSGDRSRGEHDNQSYNIQTQPARDTEEKQKSIFNMFIKGSD